MKRQDIVDTYLQQGSIRRTASNLGISQATVRKTLYDADILPITQEMREARDMYAIGQGVDAIADALKRSRSWVYVALPYSGKSYQIWTRSEIDQLKAGQPLFGRSKTSCRVKKCRMGSLAGGLI